MTYGRKNKNRTLPDEPGIERMRKTYAAYSDYEKPMSGQMLHSLMLQRMAESCGIEAPLEKLHEFADLIRADFRQEQIDRYNRFKANQPLALEYTP